MSGRGEDRPDQTASATTACADPGPTTASGTGWRACPGRHDWEVNWTAYPFLERCEACGVTRRA